MARVDGNARLAAALLLELGYATDPRVSGVGYDVIELSRMREMSRGPGQQFEASAAVARKLTDAEVLAVLDEYRNQPGPRRYDDGEL